MVSQEHHDLIIVTYFDEKNEDPHGVFALRAGLERVDVKLLFYEWCYNNPFMSRIMEDVQEMRAERLDRR